MKHTKKVILPLILVIGAILVAVFSNIVTNKTTASSSHRTQIVFWHELGGPSRQVPSCA